MDKHSFAKHLYFKEPTHRRHSISAPRASTGSLIRCCCVLLWVAVGAISSAPGSSSRHIFWVADWFCVSVCVCVCVCVCLYLCLCCVWCVICMGGCGCARVRTCVCVCSCLSVIRNSTCSKGFVWGANQVQGGEDTQNVF